jgi:hypothetical protein
MRSTDALEKKWKLQLLLVLDLDGTLIDEKEQIRPGWKDFRETCQSLGIRLALWSAGETDRVSEIVRQHFSDVKWEFIWDSSRCAWRWCSSSFFSCDVSKVPEKRLKKVWRRKQNNPWTRRNTLVLDNTPGTYAQNYGNAIAISTWTGDPTDSELHRVGLLLHKIVENPLDDVRCFYS